LTKVCLVCSAEFPITRTDRIYCSENCKKRIADHRRRQRRKQLGTSSHSRLGLRFSILARDGFKCYWCGRSPVEDGVKLAVDHKVPRAHGGTDDPSNLVSACQDCNGGKSDVILATRKGQIPLDPTMADVKTFNGQLTRAAA
jgi:5-methylcytosine-specific restriction endonuclease McrA